MKYKITVSHIEPGAANEQRMVQDLECTVDTFDLLTFVSALTATKRGRPAKNAKKEAA